MEKYIFLLLSVLSMVSISYQQGDYVVPVKFDKNNGELLELCEWNSTTSAWFRHITAEQATLYCMDDTVEGCDQTTFDSGDVNMLNGPEEFNGDILFQTYVMGLSKDALKIVLEDGRDAYGEGLAIDKPYDITLMFVDDIRVAPPIDHSVDYIMIGVSILILLSACFLALVLKCKESMAEKQKLEHYEGNRGSARTQKKTEEVNLTTIKAPDEDSKDTSEGSVNSWKNRVGPSNNNNLRTQETQTTAKVAFVSDPENAASDPRGSIHTPREPGQMGTPYHGGDGTAPYMGGGGGSRGMQLSASQRGDVTEQPENLGHGERGVTTTQGEGFVNNEGARAVFNGKEPSADRFDTVNKGDESSNLAQVKPTLPQRSSRHNILPPLGESAARDFSVEVKGGNQGSTDGSDGEGASDKKQRKRKRKQKKRKSVSSDDEKNDLLDDSFQERALSPLGEEVPVVEM
ncbi:uncharacterized protein [Apostichopus japonicus]|uniref:uncharacterized protein isoform X2 n=1 Tax=Stichopus japonicus TaxID=307972 RepID=UPI003AB6284F